MFLLFEELLASCVLDLLSCLDTKPQLTGDKFEAGEQSICSVHGSVTAATFGNWLNNK